ncbi:LytR/AlgR family response regulator transcription factor [Chryseobacterium sp. JK1]|uniref:LytR/AlgR family response regulator transcription factor n=1 Tax=Chryseobacterium sp. JK1 TaxID=874294 RepID=UPI003D693411
MYRYIIIEDERLVSEELKRMLSAIRPQYIHTATLTRVKEAASYIKSTNTADLIFLDIQLSDGISFDVFEQVQTDIPIIFTTAYDEFALKAFELNSIDYLLKPIETEDLEKALQKFEKHNKKQEPEIFSKIREVYQPNFVKKRFLIQQGALYDYIESSDIAFFYSEDKLAFLHTFSGKRYIINYTIEQIENFCDRQMFFKVSRSCVANIQSISKIVKYDNSRLKVSCTPEHPHEIIVSRKRVPDFLKWIDGITIS